MMNLSYEIVRSPKMEEAHHQAVERDRAVIVHAPEGTSDQDVKKIVDAKRQWILHKLKNPQKYHSRQHPPGKEVVNGELAPYLGRRPATAFRLPRQKVERSSSANSLSFPPRSKPNVAKSCERGTSRGPENNPPAALSNANA